MSLLHNLLQAIGQPAPKAPCGCDPSPSAGTQVRITAAKRGTIESVATSDVVRTLAFDLSKVKVDASSYQVVLNDLKALQEVIKAHPEKATQIVAFVQRGDIDQAMLLAQSIGLTEAEFQRHGGGLAFLVLFAVAIVIVLVSAEPTSIEADPAPHPSAPLTLPANTKKDVDDFLKGH